MPLGVEPRVMTIGTLTATIKASITAYSTAVGPSSLTRRRRTFEKRAFTADSSCNPFQNQKGRVMDAVGRHLGRSRDSEFDRSVIRHRDRIVCSGRLISSLASGRNPCQSNRDA
jgi:hypothetical protein